VQSTMRIGLSGMAIWLALVAIACGSGDKSSAPDLTGNDPGGPGTTIPGNAVPTATPTAEEEVTAAYLGYWQAYEKALLNLDPSLVELVASGAELQRIREEVAILSSQGVALRVVVNHNPVVIEANGNSASLIDDMVNNSFYVDPVTKQPPAASGSGEKLRDSFRLEKRDGQWWVVSSTRQRQAQ